MNKKLIAVIVVLGLLFAFSPLLDHEYREWKAERNPCCDFSKVHILSEDNYYQDWNKEPERVEISKGVFLEVVDNG